MKSIFKNKSTKIVITLLICIFILFFLSTIAYSAFSSTMNITGIARSRVEADVRITNFSLQEVQNATSMYEEYSKDSISVNVNMPANSSITYNLEITNYGTTNVGIYQIIGLPDELNYSIENYNLKDMICDDNGKCNTMIKKVLKLKINTTNGYQGNINLNFDIRTFHKITYINMQGNYPKYIIDGDTKNIDLSSDSPKFVDIKSKTNINYNYSNNILTLYSINQDIEVMSINSEYFFDYTGGVQTFTAEYDGIYKIETWGASGGNVKNTDEGGYGSYSTGLLEIKKGETFYIYVGGEGMSNFQGSVAIATGGYNGGGSSGHDGHTCWAAGGGATHIATVSGLLSTLEQYKDKKELVIVSGGGGGGGLFYDSSNPIYNGGSGGGKTGTNGSGPLCGAGGSQTAGGGYIGTNSSNLPIKSGTFGQGSSYFQHGNPVGGGGGGGYYGGGSGYTYGSSGAGGSGYIGNESLTEKYMMCYNCGVSNEVNTKTIQTTCTSENAISDCTKKGNGYTKITMTQLGIFYNITYTNIEGNYQTTIKRGNDLIVNLQSPHPKNISVLIDGTQIYDYTYENGVLNIENVMGNVEIIKKEVYDFDYTGVEQYLRVTQSGIYKIETWGAQGGTSKSLPGGYGGYSVGYIELSKQEELYINVGGSGKSGYINGVLTTTSTLPHTIIGGYNGGGNNIHNCEVIYGTSGGGATHIATVSGLLSTLEQYKNTDKILIVSGGGGGSSYWEKSYENSDGISFPAGQSYQGGHGGGYVGVNSQGSSAHKPGIFTFYGGTQTSAGTGEIYYSPSNSSHKNTAGSFGQGGQGRGSECIGGGAGSGYYGGTGGYDNSAGAGGSGHIGNTRLTNKHMTCYNCETSTAESTKTISNTCASEIATADCSKIGNGYVKITIIEVK